MYSGYTSSVLALRAKGSSSSYNHYYFVNDRVVESSSGYRLIESSPPSCAAFSIRSFPINPRFLYGYCLRQSTLIHWSPSRSFILGGARYCRVSIGSRDRGLVRGQGRRRECIGRDSLRVSESGGSFQEMVGLLAEAEACCSENGCICRDADELSVKEEGRVRLNYLGSSFKGEVGIRSCDGEYRGSSRRGDTSRDNICGVRKNGSSLSYHLGSSSSSSGGFGSNVVRHRKVIEEISRDHGKIDDFAKSDVKVVQKYKNDAQTERRSFGSESNVRGDSRVELDFQERDSDTKALSSRKVTELRFRDSKDKTALSVDSARRAREDYVREERVVGQRDSREQFQKLPRTSEVHQSSSERDSNYKKLYNAKVEGREDTSISAVNLLEELRRQQSEIDQLRKNYQELMRTSETRVSDAEGASSSSKVLANREESSMSKANLVEELRRQRGEIDQLRKNYHQLTRTSVIHESDTEGASSSKKVFNTELEGSSTSSVHLVEEARKQHSDIDQRIIGHSDSRRNSQKLNDISEINRSDIEKVSRFQRHLETRMKDSQDNLTSAQVTREKRTQTDQRVAEKMDTITFEVIESDMDRFSNFHKVSNTRIENREENSSSMLVQEAKEKQKAYMIEEKRGSERIAIPEAFSGTMESGSSSARTHVNELDTQIGKDENFLVKDDALESASCFENSSSQYVGEFVDRLHQEISSSHELDITSKQSSETEMERMCAGTSQTASVQQQNVLGPSEKYKHEIYTHEGPRQSSARSKGPSDEMWDVTGPSSQEPSRTVEPEMDSSEVGIVDPTSASTTTGNDIVRRSSRSLWSYIAEIVRKSWGPRSESHKSTMQSGTRSSSRESVGSEAWFSGHELDDDEADNVKRGRRGTPKESMLTGRPIGQHPMRTSPVTSQETSEARKVEYIMTQLEADGSTVTPTRSYVSKGSSPVAGQESSGRIDDEKGRQSGPVVAAVGTSSTLVAGLSSTINEGEITEVGKVHMPEIGFTKSEEESIREKLAEVGGTVGKDGDLKQRKLQRNKQALTKTIV